jgi:DNA-binding NtrC family response regulator
MADTTAKTILIVEPQEGIRRLLEKLLRSAGYELIFAIDAQAAWELFRAHSGTIDLLLSAATIPPMTGVELADWAIRLQPQIKILIMTASGGDVPMRRGWTYITKPFSTRMLLETIATALA